MFTETSRKANKDGIQDMLRVSGWTNRQTTTHREGEIQADRGTARQAGRQADRQGGRDPGRQAGMQTDQRTWPKSWLSPAMQAFWSTMPTMSSKSSPDRLLLSVRSMHSRK